MFGFLLLASRANYTKLTCSHTAGTKLHETNISYICQRCATVCAYVCDCFLFLLSLPHLNERIILFGHHKYSILPPFVSTLPWKAPWDKFHIPIYLFQPNWPVWCMFWGTFFKSSKSWGIFQKNRFLGSIFGVFSCSAAISEPICMKFWLPG